MFSGIWDTLSTLAPILALGAFIAALFGTYQLRRQRPKPNQMDELRSLERRLHSHIDQSVNEIEERVAMRMATASKTLKRNRYERLRSLAGEEDEALTADDLPPMRSRPAGASTEHRDGSPKGQTETNNLEPDGNSSPGIMFSIGSAPAPPRHLHHGHSSAVAAAASAAAAAASAAATHAMPTASTPHNETLLQSLQLTGRLVERIPREMKVDKRERVEVRLGPADVKAATMALGLIGIGSLEEHFVELVETMTVSLVSPSGAFEIEAESRPTQIVDHGAVKERHRAIVSDQWGKWIWSVTPKQTGEYYLLLNIAASVLDSRGIPADEVLPEKRIEIRVSVDLSQRAKGWAVSGGKLAGGGVVTGAIGGLAGGVTRDYWWPYVEAALRKIGWL